MNMWIGNNENLQRENIVFLVYFFFPLGMYKVSRETLNLQIQFQNNGIALSNEV